MRVIALLSFYDEPIHFLTDCIEALGAAGADHVVALDGRYALYPGEFHVSHPNQWAAIHLSAAKARMGCTLSVPERAWEGNEVEKRTALWQLGWSVAQEGDWFWVQDADQVVTEYPDNWRQQLEETDYLAAEVRMVDTVVPPGNEHLPRDFQLRSFFKATPGLYNRQNHYTVVKPDGTVLWGEDQVTALYLPKMVVEHRSQERGHSRLAAKMTYYTERDAQRIELGPCMWDGCAEDAVRKVAKDWRRDPDYGVVGTWVEGCEKHATRWEYMGRHELAQLGANPETVRNQHQAVLPSN